MSMLLSLFAVAVLQGAPQEAAARSELLQRLVACSAEVVDSARLVCLDAAAAALDAAERSGEVTVVDREQVRAARRSLFGIEGGDLNIFRGRGGDEAKDATLETRLDSAGQGRDGWRFTLQDGSVWRQIDDEPLRVTPRAGQPVTIRRGTIGSYLLSVDGARSLRVRRER
ncbi:MAG: hypothetical protein ACK5WW_09650 [Brevundimonas sp.]|jgi:hypothetical protein|nr:hypothetical protein [Brevundimonas sp.]MCZ8087204.1 hypothetical protein [Brevundimonas sp.]MCZ8194106.1 hypothetical protein [Brevundimonas sp.]